MIFSNLICFLLRGGGVDDYMLSVSMQTSTVSPEPSYKTWSTNSIRRRSSENSSLLLLSACIIGCPTGALQLLTARLMNHLTIANPWTHDLTNADNRPPWSWFEMLSVPQRQ